MLKDPFPNPRRQKSKDSQTIGGDYFASLKVRDPRMRIAVLLGLLVMLGLAAILLKQYSQQPVSKQTFEEPSIQTGSAVKPRYTGVPALNQQIAERISDQGPDARRRWPEEATTYLLYESQVNPAVRAYARNLFPLTPDSAQEIRADSRNWRFKYVYFRGELETVREESYDDVYGKHAEGKIGQVKRGVVRVAGGEEMDPPLRVSFITDSLMTYVDPNKVDQDYQAIDDGWVRMRGIVVKNFVDELPDGREVASLLVVATQVDRDYEIRPVESLSDINFGIIVDNPAIAGDDEGQRILAKNFPQPMFELLKYAEPRAGEPGRALREKEGLEPKAIDAPREIEEVIGNPSAHRGEYFGGKGIIALEGYRLGPSEVQPNDAGVTEYFEGWLVNDRHKLIRFVAPAPLLDRDWKERTRIRWAGFFYKALGYTARGDRSRRLAPFVVLTELEEILPEKRDLNAELMVGFGALIGLSLLVWILIRDDKTKREFRRSRRPRQVEA